MSTPVYLVACVGAKLDKPSPARDLYISDWFLKASAYAKAMSPTWFILSAKYGLLHPDQEIEPYDLTLRTMQAPQRREWGNSVVRQLQERIGTETPIVILAGQLYRVEIEAWARGRASVPMAGLGIGRQLQWLKEHLHEIAG